MLDFPTSETTMAGSKKIRVRTYGLPAVLTVAEAAEFLRLNVKTVYAAISSGDLPGRKIGGRTVVMRDALLSWLRSNECVLPSRRS